MISAIREFVAQGLQSGQREDEFNALMLRLFAYQFANNRLYRRYCEKRRVAPSTARHWGQLPAIGTDIFKHFRIACFPEENTVRRITTSGSSERGHPGQVHLDRVGFELHRLSHQQTGESFLFPEARRLRALMLLPRPQDRPGLAIIHGMSTIIENRVAGEPEYFIRPGSGLDCEALDRALRSAEDSAEPVIVMGPTFSFVHFFDYCSRLGRQYALDSDSLLLDGGGYKGISRELSKAEFLGLAAHFLGLKPSRLVNGMGLTEVSAVFFDNVSQRGPIGRLPRHKVVPPWARVVAVDPATHAPLPPGEVGLLRFHCLTNTSSVLAVQTDDLGVRTQGGFEILGRAKGARTRGCSIALDEILSQSPPAA